MQAIKARSLIALEALFVFCLVMAILYPLNPAKHPVPSRDSGVFLYVGWRILNGELPYLNVWDHKPPVIYYLDALGLGLAQGSPWGVWWLEVAFLFAASVLLYALVKRFFGFFPAALASFLWLFTLMYMLARGNTTEEYPLVMQIGALFLFYLAERERDGKYTWRGLLIGLLAGLTFFTRQTSIGVFLAIGVYIVAARLWQHDFRKLLADLLPILAGGLIVIAVVYIYFKSHGAMGRFWENAFLYNFVYAGDRDTEDRFAALLKGMDLLANVGLAPLAMFGWAASLVTLLFTRDHFSAPLRAFLTMVVIALPVEVALVAVGGRPRAPYFITLLPIFAIFSGMTLGILFDSLKQNGLPRLAIASVAIVLSLTLCAVLYNDYVDITLADTDSQQDVALLNYIAQTTTPKDTVLMWGAQTAYNFASQRRSPTRFVYQYDLYNFADEKNTTEFLNDILTEKPKLIILTSIDQKLNDFHFAYRSDKIGQLMDQIRSDYIQVNMPQLSDWVIYQFEGNQ
jgi:hypothetical protein